MVKKRNATLAKLGIRAIRSRAFRDSDSFMEEFIETLTGLGGVYAKFLQGSLLASIVLKGNRDASKQLRVFENNPDPGLDPNVCLQNALGYRASMIEITQYAPIGVGSYSAVFKGRTVKDGDEVIIKVLRPGVKEEISRDLRFLKQLAKVFSFGAPGKIPIDIPSLYGNFQKACKLEMDFVAEVEFADYMYERYKNHPHIVVPRTHLDLSNEDVIVQEYIEGISGTDLLIAKSDGYDPAQYVKEVTGSDLVHVLRVLMFDLQYSLMSGHFFHGDLHPGNIRVLPNNRIAMIDFGIRADPFSPNIVPAFVNKILSDVKIFQGDINIVRILEAHFRLYMRSMYGSLESVCKVAKRDVTQLFEGLVKTLDLNIDNVPEDKFKEWQKKGSAMAILADLIGNFKEYGLAGRIAEQSPMRALTTLNSMTVALGLHEQVFVPVSLKSTKEIMLEKPELFQNKLLVMPDLALENIYAWIERVSSTNPDLGYQIRNYIKEITSPIDTKVDLPTVSPII